MRQCICCIVELVRPYGVYGRLSMVAGKVVVVLRVVISNRRNWMDFGTKHAKEVDLFLTLKKKGLIVYTEGWSKEFTCVSGMKITHVYPLARQTCANPMPVFPAVPSTTVPPGCNLNQCYIRTSR